VAPMITVQRISKHIMVEQASGNMMYQTLANGAKLPQLGLGLWKMPKESCAGMVYNAIKNGYRLLDSACDYGNETQTGEGMRRAIDEGIVNREDLFIVSKLWNTFHRPEHVKMACQKSMADLGVDYLDLYLIHFPIAMPFVPFETQYPPEWINNDPAVNGGTPKMVIDTSVTYQQTYQAMEALQNEGLVRNIGICNVASAQLRQVLNFATIKPAVLQVEMHPYLTQQKLLRMANENGIAVMAFSNLGGTSYEELNMATPEESIMSQATVQAIAAAHSRSPAQVLLRWAVQRGTIAIPKSSKVERLIENMNVFDFELTEAEVQTINGLNKNRRFNDPGVFCEAAFGCFCPIYD